MGFRERFNLQSHERTHSMDKPFKCQWAKCGAGFANKQDLKVGYII